MRTATTFAIPKNKGKEISPEKRAAVLEVISWMDKHSLFWATAGHIPAYRPVTESAEYKAMEPNATYSTLTANMIFDPRVAQGWCRRADLRRHVHLLRADPERRDGARARRSRPSKKELNAL